MWPKVKTYITSDLNITGCLQKTVTSNISLTDLKITKNGVTQSFLESLYPTIYASSTCFMFSESLQYQNWYFAPKHLCQPLLCPFGAKKSFLSKMVQKGPDGPKMGPKWSKTFRLTILVPFGPFWTTLECWQACHVWPFLVQNGPFLGHPQSWTVDPRVKKRLIIMSPMCGLLVEPQMSPFGT